MSLADEYYRSAGTCYNAPGVEAEGAMLACGNENVLGELTCCQQGDMCLASRACYNSEFGVTYIAGCTDYDYAHESCPDKLGSEDPWLGLSYCNGTSNEWFPCLQSDAPDALAEPDACWCPDDREYIAFSASSVLDNMVRLGTDADDYITWQPGYTPSPGEEEEEEEEETTTTEEETSSTTTSSESSSSSSSTSTESSSSSSSSSLTESSSTPQESPSAAAAATSSSSGLPDGAKIGIGVGVGVGVAILLAIMATLFFLKRRRRRSDAAGAGSHMNQGHQPGGGGDDGLKQSQYGYGDAASPMSTAAGFSRHSELDSRVVSQMSELDSRVASPLSGRSELPDSPPYSSTYSRTPDAPSDPHRRGFGHGWRPALAERPISEMQG